MRQYCRYCLNAHYGDVVYCDVKCQTISEESAKRVNKCKNFDFVEVDCFDPNKKYKPRKDMGGIRYEMQKLSGL